MVRAASEKLEPRRLLATTPVVVDLLAVYTPAAATAHGGGASLATLIQGAVDTMNQAVINSEISISIRLVHAEQIAYTGSNDLYLDRTRLQTNGDGYMDSVHALRSTWGADLVTLITDGPNIAGGNAALMTAINDPNNSALAFSAIAENSIGPTNLTLAHELGHNLGAGHERNNPTQNVVGPFPYSYGYRYQVNDALHANVWYFDIMSYSYPPDVGIPYFANPNISVEGAPTGKPAGDPLQADLALTFQQTGPIVANYKTANVVADIVAPTASLLEVNRTGSALTFTVRYRDDAGLDLSTLDASDLTVNGPGGFAIPARLLSIDHPTTAGAYKLATYAVTLPATNPATSSLSFVMKSNAVCDLHSNFVAAGAIAGSTAYLAGYNYGGAQDIGSLAIGSTRTRFGVVDDSQTEQVYKFTLAAPATVSAALTGMTANANVFIARDVDLDGQYDNGVYPNGEILQQSSQLNATNDGIAINLTAGTYYAWVYRISPTPYTLTLRAYNDVTPPTAKLLATDLKTGGAANMIFAVTYSDDFEVDGETTRYWSAVDIHIAADAGWTSDFYYFPDGPAPYTLGLNENTFWQNEPSKTIYYVVPAFNQTTGWTSAENGTWTISIHPNTGTDPRVHDGAGNNIALTTLGTFKIAIGSADSVAPAAQFVSSAPVAGQTIWDFDVTYTDNVAVNGSTIDGNDVRVTGPGGFNQLASLVSLSAAPTVGSARTATYRVTAPGGFWDGTDDGSYVVALQANQVRDTSSIAVPASTLATVITSMPSLAAISSGVVGFNGTAGADVMRFDADATYDYFDLNGTMLYIPRTFVTRAVISALSASDTIYSQSGSLTGSVSGGAGTNTLNVTGGSLTLDTDSAATISVSVSTGASLTFTSSQRLTGLAVAGDAILSPGGAKLLQVTSLGITGKLDLNDNDLLLDYTGSPQVGAVQTLINSARADGAWNGSGITSSAARNANPQITTLGTMEATTYDGMLGAGSLFDGIDPDLTAVLVKYTYYGDTDFSGQVDFDDYVRTDAGFNGALAGWSNGDFDGNGSIDFDDYVYIDGAYNGQSAPL